MVYEGSLRSGEDVSASLYVISSSSGSIPANYTIWMTGDDVTINKTGTFNIDILLPYEISVSLTPSNPNILDKSTLLVVVKNIAVKDISVVDFKLSGPSSLYYYLVYLELELEYLFLIKNMF
jgi:hypothetical protein